MKPIKMKPSKDFAILLILENYNVTRNPAIQYQSGRISLLIQIGGNIYSFSSKLIKTWSSLASILDL